MSDCTDLVNTLLAGSLKASDRYMEMAKKFYALQEAYRKILYTKKQGVVICRTCQGTRYHHAETCPSQWVL